MKLDKDIVRDIIDVARAARDWAVEKQGAARYGDAEVAFYKKHEERAERVLAALPKPKAVEVEVEPEDEDESQDAEEDED